MLSRPASAALILRAIPCWWLMKKEIRNCQNCKKEFSIESEDFLFYAKIKVPPPTWCPECRQLRRFLFRNDRFLFRQKDAITGKEIFSGIPPEAKVKVYEHGYWWSDAWEPLEYGRDYDFSRPFFEQFRGLMYTIPWPSRNIKNLVNSDYCDQAGDLKNCYLCFDSGQIEASAYIIGGPLVKNSFDLTQIMRMELCYEDFGCEGCYQVFFSSYCIQCNNVWFSRDLTGCQNCFGCVNLRNKQYYIFNKPYIKEDYFAELNKFDLGSYKIVTELRRRTAEFWSKYPHKFMHGTHNTDVSGDLIFYSKNTKFSYFVEDVENSKYCYDMGVGIRDCYDYSVGWERNELMYEVLISGENCRNVKFSWDCWPANQDVEYSVKCASSQNLLGCVGLKKKSYCIFNKQYSKENYFALREKILRHMAEMPYLDKTGRKYAYGEFFPPEFSPFAYNETINQDYFPLTSQEAVKLGYSWREKEIKEYPNAVNSNDLPDNIKEVDDSMLKKVIQCKSCGGAYRIIAMELEFYKKMNLPLPRFCPECRYFERTKFRSPPKFYHGQCQCAGLTSGDRKYVNQVQHFHASNSCPNEFETSYASDRTEIVYCEECYQTEVV